MLKYNKNFSAFKNIDSEISAYLLGLIFADGHIHKNGYYLNLDLAERDVELLDMLKTYIFGDSCEIKYCKRIIESTNKVYLKLVVSSKEICDDLKMFGLTNDKSFSIKFPSIKQEFYRHFIRGYFDGDGSVGKTKDKIIVSIISNDNFLNQIQDILFNVCKIKKTKILFANRKISNIKKFNITRISDMYSFYMYLYNDANFFLKRKKLRFVQVFDTYTEKKKITPRTSFRTGVSFIKRGNVWRAHYKGKILKTCSTEKEAIEVREEYEKSLSR